MRYYVSSAGNDGNDGLSRARPITSLTALANIKLLDGDSVAFRRGDEFYGTLSLDQSLRSGGGPAVTVLAYGSGPLPVISGYKLISPGYWAVHAGNVWKVSINDPLAVAGNVAVVGTDGANIGHLVSGNSIKGARKDTLAELVADWQFYCDTAAGFLYVYYVGNINALPAIFAAPNTVLLANRFGQTITSLRFKGTGGNFCSTGETQDVTVTGCTIGAIGGSKLASGARYGNGIQCWVGGKRIRAYGNVLHDIYDTAFTMQGSPVVNAADGWDDCWFDENIIIRCNQVLELWNRYGATVGAGTPAAGSGYRRCGSVGNTSFDTGRGWSSLVRPDMDTRSPYLFYAIEAPVVDVTIKKNKHYRFGGAWLYAAPGLASLQARGLVLADESVFFEAGQKAVFQDTYVAEQWSAFKTAYSVTGQATVVSQAQPETVSDALASVIQNSESFGADGTILREWVLSMRGEVAAATTEVQALAHLTDQLRRSPGVAAPPYNNSNSNQWVRLLTVRLESSGYSFDGLFAYTWGGDSSPTSRGSGFIKVQLRPNSGLTGFTTSSLAIFQMYRFPVHVPADFQLRTVETGAGYIIAELWFNTGLDSFGHLRVTPVCVDYDPAQIEYRQGHEGAFLTAAPGTLEKAGADFSSVLIGTAPPAITPTFTGQFFTDTLTKKLYLATGTGSASDWADGSVFVMDASVPASATAPGVKGQRAADDTYSYVCTATNVWRRTAHASW